MWFQFTATGTDALISVGGTGNGGTMWSPSVAIYSGDCATTINEQGCNTSAGSGIVQLYEGAMIPGTVYYIRVASALSNEGTFELCLNNYTPSANPGADCGGAAFLCNQSPVSVGTLSGGGNNNDEPEASTCLENAFGADEGNSSWFYWTCGTAGTFTVDITPLNPMDDIDFIVYQLNTTNPCGPRTVLRCNSSSCLNVNGSTGLSLTDLSIVEDPNCDPGENAYCQFINMTVGTTYAPEHHRRTCKHLPGRNCRFQWFYLNEYRGWLELEFLEWWFASECNRNWSAFHHLCEFRNLYSDFKWN